MTRRTLLLVFLAAAALRLAAPRLAYFTADQARDVAAARRVLAGEAVFVGPAIGQTGLHLGPLYDYLLAPALLLRNAPVDALLWVAGLNALGVVLWTVLAGAVLGPRAGALAGLTLAVHPLAVLHGRTLWNPALVVPTTGIFFAGRLLLDRGRPAGGALLWLGGATMLQAHASTAPLLPLAAGRGLRPRRLAWPALLVGAALTLPWLLWDLGQLLTSAGWARLLRPYDGAAPTVDYFRAFLRALAPEAYLPDRTRWGGETWATVVRGGAYLFAAGVLLGAVRALRQGGGGRRLVLAALLPTLAVPLLPRHAYYYYLEAALPARCLLFAAAAAAGWRHALLLALLPGVIHLGGALATEVRTGLGRGGPGSLDLRAAAPEGDVPNRFPLWGAKAAVGRLLRRWGYGPEACRRAAHGPWWSAFLDDGGFWLREGGEPTGPPPPGWLLLLHREDGHPRPGPAQIHWEGRAGAFRVYRLRGEFRERAVSPDGRRWVPLALDPGRRVAPPWRHPRLVLRATLALRRRRRVRLCAGAGFGSRPAGLAVDGTPRHVVGRYRRQGVEVCWSAPVPLGPGPHRVVVTFRAPPRAGLPVTVETYALWE